MAPHKQIESETFRNVVDETKIVKILNNKIIVEHNVSYAALECAVTIRGGDTLEPHWFQLGALIKASNRTETQISNYLSDEKIAPLVNTPNNPFLFRLVTVNPSSKISSRRTARQAMLGAYVEDDNNSLITCVLPDGTHLSFSESELTDINVHVDCVVHRVSTVSSSTNENPQLPDIAQVLLTAHTFKQMENQSTNRLTVLARTLKCSKRPTLFFGAMPSQIVFHN